MAFEVKWSAEAEKGLNKLPASIIERILLKVEQAKVNPYYFMSKLIGRPHWKLRVGDYRLLCGIDNENKILKIYEVDHRSRIYKR
ncbi:type II toxin-antitoxin system RelE/ParE family toxin [archaeon]|nr:type II toxin-antitoxin system RelE/ParE family toxin [archaeon]